MKRIITLIALLPLFAGCKKDDSSPELPLNHFKIGPVEYTATGYDRNNGPYWGTGNGYGSGISFHFQTQTPDAGNYVYSSSGPNAVMVTARVRDGQGNVVSDYYSTASNPNGLQVERQNGIMIITMPPNWCKNLKGDSLLVSAHLSENL